MRKTALLASIITINLMPAQVGAATGIPTACKKYEKLALEVGFARGDLPELFRISYRESHCTPSSIGKNKNNFGVITSRDWGMTQVNDASWVTYLRDKHIIHVKEDLLNPRTNLRAALALVKYSIGRGLPKWHQWRTANPNGSAGAAAKR